MRFRVRLRQASNACANGCRAPLGPVRAGSLVKKRDSGGANLAPIAAPNLNL